MVCSPGSSAVHNKYRQGLNICIATSSLMLAACRPESAQECLRSALQQSELAGGRVVVGDLSGHLMFVDGGDGSIARSEQRLTMASLTKPMVAAEVQKRVNAGVLALDASLTTLLPERAFIAPTGAITLRQLLQHQGGFDRARLDPVLIEGREGCAAGVEYIAARPPQQPPGTAIIYSNVGYCLLGDILLREPQGLAAPLLQALRSPRGAAGGWRASLQETYSALRATMPVADLPSKVSLPDGSYYGYGWRHWPRKNDQPTWTHFGRMPGLLALAATDGRELLLVAHFSGDPSDPELASERAIRQLWRCAEWRGVEHPR